MGGGTCGMGYLPVWTVSSPTDFQLNAGIQEARAIWTFAPVFPPRRVYSLRGRFDPPERTAGAVPAGGVWQARRPADGVLLRRLVPLLIHRGRARRAAARTHHVDSGRGCRAVPRPALASGRGLGRVARGGGEPGRGAATAAGVARAPSHRHADRPAGGRACGGERRRRCLRAGAEPARVLRRLRHRGPRDPGRGGRRRRPASRPDAGRRGRRVARRTAARHRARAARPRCHRTAGDSRRGGGGSRASRACSRSRRRCVEEPSPPGRRSRPSADGVRISS